jgi:hypothetical protein
LPSFGIAEPDIRMRDFVSEKTINGRDYILLRSADEPWRNFIVRDGEEVEAPLPVWLDDAAIEALF